MASDSGQLLWFVISEVLMGGCTPHSEKEKSNKIRRYLRERKDELLVVVKTRQSTVVTCSQVLWL